VSGYHFDGAGKYFRPMVVLLAAKACNLHGKLSSFGLVDMSAVSLLHAAVGYIACNFGVKVPHLRCNSHTSFKVKQS